MVSLLDRSDIIIICLIKYPVKGPLRHLSSVEKVMTRQAAHRAAQTCQMGPSDGFLGNSGQEM